MAACMSLLNGRVVGVPKGDLVKHSPFARRRARDHADVGGGFA